MCSQSMIPHRFHIGDFPRPHDINLFMSGNEKLSFASTIQTGDGAFVRRSDDSWRYAVVHSRSYGSYSSITFKVDVGELYALKKIKQKDWCDFICIVQDLPNGDCRVERPNSFFGGLNKKCVSSQTIKGHDEGKVIHTSNANASDFFHLHRRSS